MSLKLVFVLSLAALPSAAQGLWREPMLTIDLRDSGRMRAGLWLTIPVPGPVAQAFTQAMGCPQAALTAETPPSTSVHVDCPAPVKKDGLRWSAHWDLTALNAELSRAGARAMEIDIYHPRSGSSKALPATLLQHQGAGVSVSYHGYLGLGDFHDITLEAGLDRPHIWLLAAVAGAILLLPLLLFPARASGPLPALAGANALFCLAASAWLRVTLPLNVVAMAPLPWNLAIMSAPLLAAVWIGSRIAGGPRRRIFFWRGVRAAAFLTLVAALFSASAPIMPWAICCTAVIVASSWRLHRAGGYRLQPAAEGELLTRVRQLAARAGTTVKSVQLLLGGEDLPAAFATRFGGILLSGGLLGALSRREVDAIVSHELSHVRSPRAVAARGVLFLLPVAVVLAFLVPASLEWMPLLMLPAFLLDRAMRRWNERLADTDAVTWCGDAEALITGLVRVTRAHSIPLEWPRWVRPLMSHPSTMARVRAAAARAGIPDERFAQLLAGSAAPPADCYPITGSASPVGSVFTPAQRVRLGVRLSLVGAAAAIAFGIAAPFIGYVAAFLAGAASGCMVSEWVLWRARMRARALLPGRPGVFAGFSPSVEARVYDGSYDYDWGFAAFEGDSLVFRGDRCTWTVTRDEIARIWLADLHPGWLRRPVVCFQIKSGPAFWVRPFDGAFGPAAARAASRLLDQAGRWHRAAEAVAVSAGNFDFASAPGQPPPRYTWRMLLRCLPRYGAVTLAIHWTLAPATALIDPWNLLGPVVVTSGLLLFMAYPSLRRDRHSLPSRSAPPAIASDRQVTRTP